MTEQSDAPDGIALTAFDETFNADPYRVYKRLRSSDPIHEDQAGFYERSWTISSFEAVSGLLRDERLSVDARTAGLRRDPRADNPVTLRDPDMMNLDGDDHRRLRSLVQKAFTPTSVAQFAPRIRAIAEQCLDAADEPTFDLVTVLSKPLPTMVIAEYIGVDSAHHEDFKAWTDTLLMQGYPMPTPEQWEAIVAADAALRAYFLAVIESRRAEPADDLITRLVQAQDEDGVLSAQEVVDMCCLLIGAGNFTTTDLVSTCIMHAIERGAPIEDSGEFVEACLRFDSPVLSSRRFVREDVELADVTIRRGDVVQLLLAAANHDPDVFDRPEELVESKAAKQHLAFGRGVHHCLGAPLARLEAKIAVEVFAERFDSARIVSKKWRRQMGFRGLSSLVVEASRAV